MRRFGLAVLALSALLLPARPGQTCSFAGPEALVLDPAEMAVDTTPPAAATVTATVKRGKAPDSGCGGEQTASSCDDIGIVTLIVAATDDRTAPDALGYELSVASGELPDGLTLPEGPVLAPGGSVHVHWLDGATDDQETIEVVLNVTAVDLAGNRGAAATVEISDAG